MLEQITKLEWDSNFWNKSVGNLKLSTELYNQKIQDSLSCFDFVQSSFNSNIDKNINFLVQNGFNFAELKVYLTKTLYNPNETDNNYQIKKVNPYEFDSALEVIDSQFSYSRFLNHTPIGKEQVNSFYKTWLKYAINGTFDDVCIGMINHENTLVGICTFKFKGNDAVIGLFGIHPKYQGIGLGKKFFNYLNNYLLDKNISRVSVATQSENIHAINLYTKSGFLIKNFEYIFHYMRT